jgi:hypothetical protein
VQPLKTFTTGRIPFCVSYNLPGRRLFAYSPLLAAPPRPDQIPSLYRPPHPLERHRHVRIRTTPHPPPCLDSRTSSSTTRKTSAARCVSRSLTCPTGTSGHVPAATRYAPCQHLPAPWRVGVLTPCQICQFCYNNIKTTMNGLCPACRRPYDDTTIEWKTISSEEWVPCTFSP